MENDEVIRLFQKQRRSVLCWLGLPGFICFILFICSVVFKWERWISYLCAAVFYLIAVVIPVAIRCPACRKANLSSDGTGFGFNPKQCPHCFRPLREVIR
jgi:hypothetical protein